MQRSWSGKRERDGGAGVRRARAALSEQLDPVRAASQLFELLHQLDEALRVDGDAHDTILTTPYPEPGLGAAIADRLRRASAER